MGLLEWVTKQLQGFRFPRSGTGLFILPRTKYDFAYDVGQGRDTTIVEAVLQWIARNFPEPPVRLYRRAGAETEVVGEHPFLDLLNYPNPYYSLPVLWMATIIDWWIDGNAYWLILRSASGRPVRLLYTPTWAMEPKWDVDNQDYVTHYDYHPGGVNLKVPPEDVVHFRYGIDPENVRKGRSPLKTALREIWTDEEAANYTAHLLRNMGVPGVILIPEGGVRPTKAEADAAAQKWKQDFTGDKRGMAFVAKAPMRVEQVGFSPKDMDISSLRDIPEERITAIMGVPAAVVGLGTGLQQTKVGATMAEMREMAYENNIIPTQRLFAADLKHQLLVHFVDRVNDWEVAFDYSNVRVLQEDENKRAERVRENVKARLMTVAEGRRQLGMEAGPEHEVYLTPVSVIPEPAGQPPSMAARKEVKRAGGRAHRRLLVGLLSQERKHRKEFGRELKKTFDDLGERAARAFLEMRPRVAARTGDGRKAPPEDEIAAQAILRTLDLDAAQGDLKGLYTNRYRRVAEDTYSLVRETVGVQADLDEMTAQTIMERGGKRVGLMDLAEHTRRGIFRALEEGREAGETAPEMAQRIKRAVSGGRWRDPYYRAQVVARTEVKYAQNLSALEAYKAGGVEKLVAADALLGPTDEDCEARDGDVFTYHEAEVELQTEHPNGTLVFLPLVE